MTKLLDLDSINLFDFDQTKLDSEKINALCFSETLLVSCFHSKIIEKPAHVNIKKIHQKVNINGSDAKAADKSDEKILEQKYNNFHFFFFDQKINNKHLEAESVILVNGFPKLQPNKCNITCCCRTMMCICNQVNFDDDGSEDETENIVMVDSTDDIHDERTHSLDGEYVDSQNSDNQSDDFKTHSQENSIENLSIENSTPVGGMTISIQKFGKCDDKFIVYSSSKYHENEFNVCSEIISIVGMDLNTVEENKTRNMKQKNVYKEYKCLVAIDRDLGFDVKITNRDENAKQCESKYINPNDAKNCILDGANIVLLRYLALTKYEGLLKTKSMSLEGECCDNIYACKIIQGSLIENQSLPLLKVSRKVIGSDQLMKKGLYYLTLTGNLVRIEWSDSNYIIHLNPLLPIDPNTNEISRHVPLRKNWQNDLELFSKYMDYKNKRLTKNEEYLKHHTILRDLLSDYLATILSMKPKEVLPFTRSYFGSFTERLDLPHNNYFEKKGQHVHYSYYQGL